MGKIQFYHNQRKVQNQSIVKLKRHGEAINKL